MTADPSTRERVLQAIVDIFIEGEKVTVSAVAVRSGLSRQRIHGEGLRPSLRGSPPRKANSPKVIHT